MKVSDVYTVYGESIESNLLFDTLPRTVRDGSTITLDVQRIASFEKDPGEPIGPCYAQDRTVHIVYHDLYVAVQIDSILDIQYWIASNTIQCLAVHEMSDESLRYWILQQIIPLYVFLRGSTEFLHGMAFRTTSNNDTTSESSAGCVAVLGPSHAGKSTLLNYFLTEGHALVTDDHIAIHRQSYADVQPAIPFYRPYRAAEDLGYRAANYSPDASPLRHIYLLKPAPATMAPQAQRITGIDAVCAVASYLHYTLPNSKKLDHFPLVDDRFRGLAEVARQVPVSILRVPRSLDRLPEVYEFIQKDVSEATL
ncbi:hypothetical protein [Granulicella arctica]|uniref:HPr kinase n=1 Tax=Granulicella arctica TaxID=940613 RepID=A0A7Y9PEN9_9BACT|nr:hypothetical protein [Granulicella arctica]NYF78407.1 hypothetical protein [Granulicella arctica]